MQVLSLILPRGGVLVAGAGGGFDFLCGLPIVLELERRGHSVHIANYSFTQLSHVRGGTWYGEHLLEITADARLAEGDYFPEQLLARWYRDRKAIEKPVWCLAQTGVAPTTASYNYLVDRLGIQTVICIDGGVDGLFRGDEWDPGAHRLEERLRDVPACHFQELAHCQFILVCMTIDVVHSQSLSTSLCRRRRSFAHCY